MDTGTTHPASGTSSAASHGELPSSMQQQATLPHQAPTMGIRLPQAGFPAAPATGTAADPASRNHAGKSAAELAMAQGHRFLAAAVSGSAASAPASMSADAVIGNAATTTAAPTAFLASSTVTSHTAALQAARQAGAKVEQVHFLDKTALMFAAKNGHTSTLQALLQASAEVDMADSDSMTALMYAAINGHTVTVQALLKAGANRALTSRDDATALSLATDGKHEEVIRLLRA
jgi:hypothetical protein